MKVLFIFIVVSLCLTLIRSWCLKTIFASSMKIRSVDFSPDGEYILTGSSTGRVLLWKSDTLEILKTYTFPVEVWQAVFSKNQQLVAIGGAQNVIHIINTTTFAQVRTIDTQHNNIVFDLDFRYDSQMLLTCGDDGKTKIWKVSDGSNVITKSNKHQTYSCEYADNDKFVVAGRHYYETFDAAGTLVHQFHDGNYGDFYGLRVRPGGAYFVATNGDGNVFESSWAGANTFHQDGTGGMFACAYSRDSTYFVAGGTDGNIYVYNATNRANILEAILRTNSTSSINSSQFSYDSNYLVAGDENGSVYYYQRFCHGCPTGSYPNKTACIQCAEALVGCSVCVNSSVCKSCQSGYYIDTSSNICLSCDVMEGCANCNSSTNCTSCLQGFFLNGLTCSKCALAMPGCYQCKLGQCFDCENDYYLSGGVCVNCTSIPHCLYCRNSTGCFECVAGYAQVNGLCQDCSQTMPHCFICSNETVCQSCQSGYRLNSTSLCQKCAPQCLFCNSTNHCFDCVEQMYLTSSFACDFCVHPCFTCNSSTYCLSCVAGYYLFAAGVCTNCPAACLSCNTSSRCQSCDVGYYLDVATHTCKKCSQLVPNCRECTPTSCLVCQLQYHLDSGSCSPCSSIISNCMICDNATVCQLCMTGYYPTGLTGSSSCGLCEVGCTACKSATACTSCKQGYYISGQDCLLCSNRCLTCTSSAASACTSCIEGYYLSTTTTGTCLACSTIPRCSACLNSTYCVGCNVGYFLSSPTTCTACTPPCTTCKTSATDCLTCDLGFYQSSSGGLGVCSACNPECSQCSTSASICLNCVQGYYHNPNTSQCIDCSLSLPGCNICDDQTNCIVCSSGYYSFSGSCVLCSVGIAKCVGCNSLGTLCYTCDYGFHLSSANTSCALCQSSIPNCEHCSSSSLCQTCKAGNYFSGGVCLPCSTGCLTCSNGSICEVCVHTYVLLASKSCQLCEDAMVGCQVCTSNAVCTDCVIGYYLSAQVCYSCQSALVGCEHCSDSTHCLQCNVFYQLLTNSTCALCSDIYPFCQLCSNTSVECLECRVGYFLDTATRRCMPCSNVTSQGCLQCSSNISCSQCMSGYYLNTTTALCIKCDSLFPNCVYCTSPACLQCESGYYLSGGVCSACNNTGCEVCLQNDPTKCVTCNSRYYLSVDTCTLCSQPMPQCLQCQSPTTCTECASGFHLSSANQCVLCSSTFPGCSVCSASGCVDCMANFFLNSTDLLCHNCTDHIPGCAFCLSQLICISCQNGYYMVNNTCLHCSAIPGCLYCTNDTTCSKCQQSYYLSPSDNACYSCLLAIPFCYACDNNSTCISCQGHYQLLGSQCVQIKGQVTRRYTSIGIKSFYVNQSFLKHTLFAREFQFSQIQQDWPNVAQLTLIGKDYTRYPLTIAKVEWANTLKEIYFTTDNPIADQLSQSVKSMPFVKTSRRMLEDASLDLGFNLKFMLNEKATHDIMPSLDHLGDLYLDYPYSDSAFYESFIRNKSYSYYIIGLIFTLLLLVGYSVKLCCLLPRGQDRGSIIPHIFAIKCGALALYPAYAEYVSFCYGFTTADFPWANAFFGSKFGNPNDQMPDSFAMFYVNLSLGSTYFLALVLIPVIWFCVSFAGYVCDQNRMKIESMKSLLYNFFAFGAIFAGCLSLQGVILNPLDSLSANTVLYVIGIVVYFGIAVQICFSWMISKSLTLSKLKANDQDDIQTTGHLRKLRIFVKATLLSITHLGPLYIIGIVFCIQIGAILLQYYLTQVSKVCPKVEAGEHFIVNLALLLLILVPDALVGIVMTSCLIVISISLSVYRTICQYGQIANMEELQVQGADPHFPSQSTEFDLFGIDKKTFDDSREKMNRGIQSNKREKNTSRVWFDQSSEQDSQYPTRRDSKLKN